MSETSEAPEAPRANIAIDLTAVQVPFLVTLQHTLDVLAVTSSGIHEVTEVAYGAFRGGFLSVGPAATQKLSLPDAQRRAQDWVLRNAFRDAVDATGLFFDSVQIVAALVKAASSGQLIGATFTEITTTEALEFRKLGIAKKVQALREVFGLTLQFYEIVYSINAVRNCLVHRLGVVGPSDVDSGGSLTLRYEALELFSPNPDGSGEVIIDRPGVAVAGEIKLRRIERARSFSVGDQIVLTGEEIAQIFGLLMQFAMATGAELQARITGLPSAPTPATAL